MHVQGQLLRYIVNASSHQFAASAPRAQGHGCGSTNRLWNRCAGQIWVQFAALFLGPRLLRLIAACMRLLLWTPSARWAHNGSKSVCLLETRQVCSRLLVEAKAIRDTRGAGATAHGDN